MHGAAEKRHLASAKVDVPIDIIFNDQSGFVWLRKEPMIC
jgi:hypothetical protein